MSHCRVTHGRVTVTLGLLCVLGVAAVLASPSNRMDTAETRLLVLVNGGRASAEGRRAEGLTRGEASLNCRFLYREASRLRCAAAWLKEIRTWRPQLIYNLNTALPGAWVACHSARHQAIPFVLDTGDAVYEMARSAGTRPAWSLPLLRALESQAQRRAAAIVVRGHKHREHLLAQGYPNVTLIRDGYAEAPAPTPAQVCALRERLGLKDVLVVGVLGSLIYSPRLNLCYGWDIIQALARLRDLPIKALVVGGGPGLPWLQELAKTSGTLDRVAFVGQIPYAEVPLYLRVMDVAVSTQTNNLAGQVRTTGKLPEYMAAGRYILASRVGDAELLLPEEMLVDYAGAVDPDYPGRLAERIRQLTHNPEWLRRGAELAAVAREHCSYSVLARQFALLAHSLMGKKS